MSQDGQCDEPTVDPAMAMAVCTFPMPAGTVFDWHTHDDHQLAWAASGVLTIRSGTQAWVLPPTRALWIPAGIRHETLSEASATMRTAYVRPEYLLDIVVELHASDCDASGGGTIGLLGRRRRGVVRAHACRVATGRACSNQLRRFPLMCACPRKIEHCKWRRC